MDSNTVVINAERFPMENVIHHGPHQLYRYPSISVESRSLKDLHQDEIRVKMMYAGVCGTDVHLAESNPETGYIRSSAPAEIPSEGRVIGHEGVGQVIEIGSNVRHLENGAYVTFESIIVCHFCDPCRKGQFNQCHNAKLLGLEKDGLFGNTVDVPAKLAHDVTRLVQSEEDLKAMACVEPAGVAYVACQNTRVAGGDTVVVFGAGPIGLFSALIARTIFGASYVHIVEPVEFRREFARKWCDSVYDVDGFFADCPADVDVVIEASGDLSNITRIFRKISANGRVALLARSSAPLSLDAIDHMITNEINLVGSRGHLCGAFSHILRLFKQNRIELGGVVTKVIDGPESLARAMQQPASFINENCKVLVRLGERADST